MYVELNEKVIFDLRAAASEYEGLRERVRALVAMAQEAVRAGNAKANY